VSRTKLTTSGQGCRPGRSSHVNAMRMEREAEEEHGEETDEEEKGRRREERSDHRRWLRAG
jgi:hypothetical protein